MLRTSVCLVAMLLVTGSLYTDTASAQTTAPAVGQAGPSPATDQDNIKRDQADIHSDHQDMRQDRNDIRTDRHDLHQDYQAQRDGANDQGAINHERADHKLKFFFRLLQSLRPVP